MKEFHFNESYSHHNKPIIKDSLSFLITVVTFIFGLFILGTMVYMLIFQLTLKSIGVHIFGLFAIGVVVYRVHAYMNLIDSVIIENDRILIKGNAEEKCISFSDLIDFDVIRRGQVGITKIVFTYTCITGVKNLNYYVFGWLWEKSVDRKLGELEDEINSIVSKNFDGWRK